jgi:hypothetical protein
VSATNSSTIVEANIATTLGPGPAFINEQILDLAAPEKAASDTFLGFLGLLELSQRDSFLGYLIVARRGTMQWQRDEAWFFKVYGRAALESQTTLPDLLGEGDAVAVGDLFCAIVGESRSSGLPPHSGLRTAAEEAGSLGGISDLHAMFLGMAAAGALCGDEASYRYVLESQLPF